MLLENVVIGEVYSIQISPYLSRQVKVMERVEENGEVKFRVETPQGHKVRQLKAASQLFDPRSKTASSRPTARPPRKPVKVNVE